MATCASCSAPLPPNKSICAYCGNRNDVDLKLVHDYTIVKPDSGRICPRCSVALETIDLKIEGSFYIERCEKCLGLFFDPNELQTVLDKSVAGVFEVNQARLRELNDEPGRTVEPVSYVKCPVCRQMMNRVSFGYRSGVVVDQCREHGVWLDGGELRRLLEWRKAGGQLLDERVKKENAEREARREHEAGAGIPADIAFSTHGAFPAHDPTLSIDSSDVVHAVGAIARWLLR